MHRESGECRAEAERGVSEDEVRLFLRAQYAKVPSRFVAGDVQSRDCVLYGLDSETGVLGKNGVVFLRDRASSASVEIDLETPPNPQGYPRSATFTLRNQEGEPSRVEIDLTTPPPFIRIPLPARSPESVYEFSWHFDYSNCTSPVRCTSGILRMAGFQR